MKAAKGNIFHLSAIDFAPGACSICGENVVIRFRDLSVGWQLGTCCIPFALFAEAILDEKKTGICHPTGAIR